MRLIAAVMGVSVLLLLAVPAHADDLLSGSTQALFLGPTGIPNPEILPGYIPAIDTEYLIGLGLSPDATLTPLVTPETPDFGPSIGKGVTILVNAVEADYNAGTISAADPLTIVGYSQSTVIESQAEPLLAADGIPSGDLRFVMLGDAAADPPSGATGILNTWGDTALGEEGFKLLDWGNLIDAQTPNDLYPTAVYDLPVGDDFWAATVPPADFLTHPLASIGPDLVGFVEHAAYIGGLPESEITGAIPVVDGLTDYYTLAPPVDMFGSLISTALTDLFG